MVLAFLRQGFGVYAVSTTPTKRSLLVHACVTFRKLVDEITRTQPYHNPFLFATVPFGSIAMG